MQPLLEADALVRRLVNGRPLLDRISIRIAGGDRIAIQGSAGSGKSLLLRALAQLDPLDSGTIRWLGKPVRGPDVPAFRSDAAYLAQTPALAEGTVETNLQLPFSLRIYGDTSWDREHCLGLLDQFERDRTFLAQPVETLSGGERQIVALVRLLQLRPRLLLLDEPTAALDPNAASRVQRVLHRWIRSDAGNRAFTWVSHDHRQAGEISNRTVRMDRGRLIEERAS